jgi:hypothetical protein
VYISAPNSFVTIPRWLATKWLAMFPNDFLPGDNALAAIDPAQSQFLAAQEKAKKLEEEKKNLQAELDALRNQIAGRAQPLG